MGLEAGARIGPYEVISLLGAGGMGEVYRARDHRLEREVAIKILPDKLAEDSNRLRRFEQEARAAGQLQHPNVMQIHDIGREQGKAYVVSELLEGENLRQRLGGTAIGARRATEYAIQIANGLAAAHEKGIVHRDLKPENIFVTRDGQVKILDFGLAKLTGPEPGGEVLSQLPTEAEKTGPGVVLGTVGYMSPEQVRGQAADHRSDIFSLGTVLYEMLTGSRPFQAESSVELMNAILKEDPPELSQVDARIPPALDRTVRHCMEKNPEERFQSARDLAYDLQRITSDSGISIPLARAPGRSRGVLAVLGLILIAAVAGFLVGKGTDSRTAGQTRQFVYDQLTFKQGRIYTARYSPDGRSIVYGAAWRNEPMQLYTNVGQGVGSRALHIENAEILSIGPDGEMAILLDRKFFIGWMSRGTLATVPVSGGAPRDLMNEIQGADHHPVSGQLAVVHQVGGRYRLEFPAGNVLYETTGWISRPRFSRDGERIAFIDHPVAGDSKGHAAVVDLEGRKSDLAADFGSATGIDWSPSGDEVWFSASKSVNTGIIHAITLEGEAQILISSPTPLTLHDVSPTGEILASSDIRRRSIMARAPGAEDEVDLSWLDWSLPIALSEDGQSILFMEQGLGGGPDYGIYLRSTTGSPAVRLGEGVAADLSADGRWALALPLPELNYLKILPTGAGAERTVSIGDLELWSAQWGADTDTIFFLASTPESGFRIYRISSDGGTPVMISDQEQASAGPIVSEDGRSLCALDAERKSWIYDLENGSRSRLEWIRDSEFPFQWTADGEGLFVMDNSALPARIYLVDVETGDRKLYAELMPSGKAGVLNLDFPSITPDGRAYSYSFRSILSTLYVIR